VDSIEGKVQWLAIKAAKVLLIVVESGVGDELPRGMDK